MLTPLRLRKLKAEMELKDLDLATVARRAEVPYSTASQILNGRRVDPLRLSKLADVIHNAAMPREVQV